MRADSNGRRAVVPRISAAVAASITWGIGSFPLSPPFSWGKFCF